MSCSAQEGEQPCTRVSMSFKMSWWCYMEKAAEARHRLERQYNACANLKKQCRPNETNTPMQHTFAKDKILLQMATPQAASSQRTHVSRTQRRGRTNPVNRRVTTQYLHTQSVTTLQRCGLNGRHEAPRELSTDTGIGIAANHAESKVPGAAGGGGRGAGEVGDPSARPRLLVYWLHGVFVGDWLFVFPLCGFSLSLFCNY